MACKVTRLFTNGLLLNRPTFSVLKTLNLNKAGYAAKAGKKTPGK